MEHSVQRGDTSTAVIVRHQKSLVARALLTGFLLFSMPAMHSAIADELQDFARQCDLAIGTTVPDFDCDAGTEVPGQGPVFSGNQPGVTCDEPNRLNRRCDPGSRFQVLTRSDDAYIVAHCRKEGGESGMYGDIAVIQYNRKNGATCFYQALGNQDHGNMPGGHTAPGAPAKPVKAPSNGQMPNTFWLSPSATVAADHCGRCHDNGPFIRSPYINQVHGSNELPGSQDFGFNKDQPYGLVGQPFASWKAYKVEISGNECNNCHRLGISNKGFEVKEGTALDFAIRATAKSEVSKNPPSDHSPIWMPPVPVQLAFNQAHADSAKAIHDCAMRLGENPLPNSDGCRITLFAQAFVPGVGPPGAPQVMSVSPTSGQCGGPTNITIQGSNFSGATAVTAVPANSASSGISLLNVSVTSNSQIAATVPGTLTAGLYEIVVQTPLGFSIQPALSARTDLFGVGPTITSVSPNQGPVPGGTGVTITGTCFDSPGQNQNFVRVFFGGTEGNKGFDQCASSTHCVVYSPPAANVSQVDVVVDVNGSGSATSPADRFTYTGPIITELDPNHGPKTGGTSVEITGGGFPPYTGTGNNLAVAFGSAQTSALCLGSTVNATSSCSVVTPPVNNAGPAQVVATAFGESSPASPASVFSYEEYPALTKLRLPDAFFGIGSAIFLNGNAPQGGAAVAIASSDPSVVQSQIVTIPAGSQSASVPLRIFPTPQAKQVTLTASYQGSSVSAILDVDASPPLTVVTPTNLDVNESGTVQVSLNTPAPGGGATVVLSSSDPAAITLPPSNSVTIAGGGYSASFSITNHYSGAPKSVKIFGTYNGASASSSILVPSAMPCVERKCPKGSSWDPEECACVPSKF